MSLKSIVHIIRSSLFREDHVCPWWMAYSFDNPLRRWLHDPRSILSSLLRPGMTIADIGCGMGYFSVPMATMVGEQGRVLAIDLQKKMLARVEKRARKRGVSGRILYIEAAKDDIRLNEDADFVLTFWMVHEVDDIPRFFRQIYSHLAPDGTVLVVEPKMHVPLKRFNEIIGFARNAGFIITGGPKVRISRSAVLRKK